MHGAQLKKRVVQQFQAGCGTTRAGAPAHIMRDIATGTVAQTMSAVLGNNRFLLGLAKSLGVILASEIGDKTFFIAAVMAMRNPRMTVSSGKTGISRAQP